MIPPRRALVSVTAASLLITALTSCAPTAVDGWSDLTSSDQEAADLLPASVEQSDGVEDIDPDSVRLQWESEGVAYYSARSSTADDTGCLIVVEEDTAESACGQSPPLVYETENGAFALGNRAPANSGWEELTPVLWRKS